MAKQLNSVPDTKGEKSKEENSSLARDEDQYTKPQSSVENKAGSEEQGVLQEEFGAQCLRIGLHAKVLRGESGRTAEDMGGPTVPKTLQKAAGQEGLELVKVEQVKVGPGCVYTWLTYQPQG